MSYTLAPYAFAQFFDGSGDPLALGSVSVYLAGTATPATTYSDSAGTPNIWPVPLDSEGRCVIYLGPFSYKFVVKNSLGVTIPGGTQDTITAIGAGAAGLGQIFSFGGFSSSPIVATSYASGATFDKLHPGTAVFEEDSNNLTGTTYKLRVTGLIDPSGTLTVALVNLSDGAPDTPIATATITSLTGAVATSGAITFGAVGVVKQYGIKVKVSANTGYAWGAELVRTA